MHLLLILLVILIIFGPGKLPEIGEGLGKSIRSFKKAISSGSGTEADAAGKTEEKRS